MSLAAKVRAVFHAVAGTQRAPIQRIAGKTAPSLPRLVTLIPARGTHCKQLGERRSPQALARLGQRTPGYVRINRIRQRQIKMGGHFRNGLMSV